MKIYLDCCSIQRPFDDRSQPRIAVEAEAILVALALCESNQLELVSSDALLLEIDQIPDPIRKEDAMEIIRLAEQTVELTSEIEILAREFGVSGIKTLDALHLAFASFSRVDYFCTCDDKFIRKAKSLGNLNTKVVSPTELVMELDL
jgi:predicted nucleic acid-binding protein